MTVIGIAGDLHLSDKAPTKCRDSYNDDLFGLLAECVEIAKARKLDAFVFAGDLFHIKRPDRTSHRTVQRMIDVVQAFPCPVYGVIGNHDIQNDRLESVFETQPFGILLQAGMILLDEWAEGLPLYGVPWQQDWHAGEKAFDAWAESDNPEQQPTNSLLVTHAPLYPPGQENPWECIPAPMVAEWMSFHGHLYYGHVHDLHGVFEADGVTFCNQGALSRGSLQESDFNRRPAITVWRSGVVGPSAFERVELATAKSGAEVFRVEEHMAKVDYAARMEDFLAAVGNSAVAVSGIEDVIAHVRTLALPRREIDLAVEVLTDASTGGLAE